MKYLLCIASKSIQYVFSFKSHTLVQIMLIYQQKVNVIYNFFYGLPKFISYQMSDIMLKM